MDNLHVIEGMAPEALEELPAPDCVFIGAVKESCMKSWMLSEERTHFKIGAQQSLETMMQVLKYTEE